MASELNWIEFTVNTTQEASDAVCEMLFELGAEGVSVEDPSDIKQILNAPDSLAYADDAFIDSLGSDVVIKAYFPSEGEMVITAELRQDREPMNRGQELYADRPRKERSIAELKRQIISRLVKIADYLPVGDAKVNCVTVREEEWADNWKKDYKPFRLSERITVSPSWEEYSAGEGEHVIYLDPGSAFGTGTHETTSMCAELLDRILRPGDRVLDLGCGSGILSIIADRLGAEYVEAIDIDRTAIMVASENINANRSKVKVHCGVLTDAYRKDYSIVVANIIADVLIDLCPSFPEYLNEGGLLLVSGIIDHRSEEVLRAYKERDYALIESVRKGDWHAYLFSRAGISEGELLRYMPEVPSEKRVFGTHPE